MPADTDGGVTTMKAVVRDVYCSPGREDLHCLRELMEAGKVTPVVDRTYALSDAPEVIPHLRTGRAGGKVVIRV